jgi:hypothetical protein
MQILIETERPRVIVDQSGTITRSGGKILVLDERGLLDATTNMTLTGAPSASFTLMNPQDRWFNSARKLSMLTRRQKEVADYMTEVLRLSTVTERNDKRRERFWQLFREGKITKWGLRLATAFGVQTENGIFTRGDSPENRIDAYSLYEYFTPELDLMNRVWINWGDRNNKPNEPSLVAGFSGYITTVTRNRAPGSHGTITVQCSGLLGLMQRSEIVLSQALDQRFEPLSGEDIQDQDMQPTTNALAGLNGVEIVERCVTRTQNLFCYNSGTASEIAAKNPDDYFHQDKLWQLTGDRFPEPNGAVLSNNVGFGPNSIAYDPARIFVESVDSEVGPRLVTGAEMNGKLVIDPDILTNEKGEWDVFRKMIRQTFAIYQNTNQAAFTLAREVADTLGYNLFEDPKGNVVFQVSKYDVLPRLRGDKGIAMQDTVLEGDILRSKYTEDYSRIPYHDFDYILDSVGDIGQRFTETEANTVNYVMATGEPNWHQQKDSTIKYHTATGATSPKLLFQEFAKLVSTPTGMLIPACEEAEMVRRHIRRYGVRRHNARALIVGPGSTNLLTRYALSQMISINAGGRTGTVNLDQRPDIWVGRTVFLVEAQRLGYVVGASNAFNRSGRGPHNTTLTLAHCHHPNERIGVPWLLNTDSPQAKAEVTPRNLLYDKVAELFPYLIP